MVSAEETETVTMTDLADALSGPQATEISQDVLSRLDRAKRRIDAEMAAGMPLGQIEAYRAVSRSLATSHAIVLGLASR